MLQEILSDGALSHFATIGLVIFVAVFLGVTVWILTRSKREVRQWSELPLAGDDDEPRQPRRGHATPDRDDDRPRNPRVL